MADRRQRDGEAPVARRSRWDRSEREPRQRDTKEPASLDRGCYREALHQRTDLDSDKDPFTVDADCINPSQNKEESLSSDRTDVIGWEPPPSRRRRFTEEVDDDDEHRASLSLPSYEYLQERRLMVGDAGPSVSKPWIGKSERFDVESNEVEQSATKREHHVAFDPSSSWTKAESDAQEEPLAKRAGFSMSHGQTKFDLQSGSVGLSAPKMAGFSMSVTGRKALMSQPEGDPLSSSMAKKPVAPIKMSLGVQKPKNPVTIKKPAAVASVFNEEDDSDEEEMPPEAKMRMRNLGRETPTAAGPNSFGKGQLGFCDRHKIIQRELQKKMDQLAPTT